MAPPRARAWGPARNVQCRPEPAVAIVEIDT